MLQVFGKMLDKEGLELPPKVFIEMKGEFIEFIENKSLTIRFHNQEKYMNPFHFMQGGMITAAIDNTVSPFGYSLAKPHLTKEIITQYKRPIRKSDKYITVKASLHEMQEDTMILKAGVRNEENKLAAKAWVKCAFI
ncbi:PaaI family thioesterase [Sulfurovum sp. zt1-1]|uniref:PaaI family thioesterase n=2 Tax=Sulfurovum zhangzhouensis TaxID=3019067 RepID=A0ABT7QX27_9BACT|nr:PaaI family thioesterase [Sulfurovum zhangzhouensis]